MLSLFLRNLLFTILQPGVVGVLIPYLILRNRVERFFPGVWSPSSVLGLILMVVGMAVVLACIIRFATEGKGTLSPLDPTKRLVVHGLYRYSRNPMYVGMMLLLAGEAVFYWSVDMLIYAVVVFVAFNLFIWLHEEPRLRREFGPEYDAYVSGVRRWI